MDSEDRQMLNEIAEQVDTIINEACDKYCLDRSFFEFHLKVNILGEDWNKYEEVELINDHHTFCDFCGTRTRLIKGDVAMCAECYGKTTQPNESKNQRLG